MAPKDFDLVVGSGQVSLGQRGMDLAVADVVQQNNRPTLATLQFWDQMVEASWHPIRNRAVAKWADRIGHGCGLWIVASRRMRQNSAMTRGRRDNGL